ncbi:MAG TPA: HAMP domain-containing histidine kinase [Saprospiraceae bacterium]|nr:HAMP domain-containing histidine kinase [Saprospiraceae bacterium]
MNKIVITLVLAALLGLAIIQLNFIRIGFQLEHRRFDQKINQTLIDFREHLSQQNKLSQSLIDLFKEADNFFLIRNDSLLLRAQKELDQHITNDLQKNGIDIPVEYAITGTNNKPIYLTTLQLPGETMEYGKYFTNLGRRVERNCDCRLFLHLYSNEFTSYVLGRLAYLILPSVLSILTIIICLGLLIYTLKKQQKLHEIKNDFINNLTHELKTPVFSISLANKLLRQKLKKKDLAESEKFLDIIDKQNEQLKVHINRVLELASLEDDKHHLQKEPTDINQLIQTVVKDYRLKLATKNGQIHFYKNGSSPQVLLDKTHFRNVLQNLIENAIKYSTSSPQISIETCQSKNTFTIKVKDNGIGIAEEHQQNIFDKFYRIPTGDLHQVKGFGLGLSYVKQIVEAHNGTIHLQSKKGEGSSFVISLKDH